MIRYESTPSEVARSCWSRFGGRAVAACLVASLALLPVQRRADASTDGGDGGNPYAGGGDYGAGRAAALTIGIGAAVAAVAGVGIWWFFFRDGEEAAPAALSGEAGPVDVSSGPRIGFDCPPGADGNATVTCW